MSLSIRNCRITPSARRFQCRPTTRIDPRTSDPPQGPDASVRNAATSTAAGRMRRSGATKHVVNPATGATIGTTPQMGADDTRRAIDAAAAAFPGWRAKTAKETKRGAAQVVRSDARQQRRSRADPHHRAGQAARGVEGRDRDRRGVHRVVRRGGEARLRRRDPDDLQ